jgi:chromosome partitioning protein
MLEKFLAKVQDKYDVIIVDCAPTESLLTTASYMASDYVLVPVKPEYLSTIGLPLLARSLQEFHAQNEDYKVELAGIVFNHASDYAPEESTSKAEVRAMAASLGWHVFNSEIRYSRSYPKGAREGRPIFGTSMARGKAKTKFYTFTHELAQQVTV